MPASETMRPCGQCGAGNEPGHLFCRHCQADLNPEAAGPVAAPSRKAAAARRNGRVLFWLLVPAVCGLGFLLALWPAPPKGPAGTDADAQMARRKMDVLESGAVSAPQRFRERELNAYLAHLLRDLKDGERSAGWGAAMQAAAVSIRPNAVQLTAVYVWGPFALGSWRWRARPVTCEVTAVPERTAGGWRWTIKRGRVGRLALPRPFSALAAGRMHPLRAAARRELVLLAALRELELEDGSVTVALRRPEGAAFQDERE